MKDGKTTYKSRKERFKAVLRDETKRYFNESVNELINNSEIITAFQELNDLIRAYAEERFDTIRERKRARNKIVRAMLNKYW